MVTSGRLWSRWLLAGLAVCCAGGLVALTLVHARSAPLVYDESIYLLIAEQITQTRCPIQPEGNGTLFSDNPPLVTYVTALIRTLGGTTLSWLRTANIALWAVPTYAAVGLLAASMFGVGAALLALVSLYTQQRFIQEAAVIKLDVPLAALSALFLLCLYRIAKRERTANGPTATEPAAPRLECAACALLAALACLTKHQGVLVPIAGTLYLLLRRWIERDATAQRSLRYPEAWILGGGLAGGLAWFVIATGCGGSFLDTMTLGLRRVTFQTQEPWFHDPLLTYWGKLRTEVGPLFIAGSAVSVVLWGKRLLTDARLSLLFLWVLLTFVFCSSIGLRHERYFLPAVPALAVLIGSLAAADAYQGFALLRRRTTLAWWMRIGVIVLVVAATGFSLGQLRAQMERIQQIGERSNIYYREIGSVIRNAISRDERVLISRVQTAYFAERNYFMGCYEVDGTRLVQLLSNPDNRITAVAVDSSQPLHSDMPQADQNKVWDYVNRHFTTLPGTPRGATVYHRVSW